MFYRDDANITINENDFLIEVGDVDSWNDFSFVVPSEAIAEVLEEESVKTKISSSEMVEMIFDEDSETVLITYFKKNFAGLIREFIAVPVNSFLWD